MLYRLMRKAGAPFLAGALVGTLILFPYAVMTGFSVSAKRAVLMYLIRMGAEVSGRVYDLHRQALLLSIQRTDVLSKSLIRARCGYGIFLSNTKAQTLLSGQGRLCGYI